MKFSINKEKEWEKITETNKDIKKITSKVSFNSVAIKTVQHVDERSGVVRNRTAQSLAFNIRNLPHK